MEINWSKIATEALVVIAPILAMAVIGWLTAGVRLVWAKAAEKLAYIKSKQPTLAYMLDEASRFAVRSAQQIQLWIKKHPEIANEFIAAGETLEKALLKYAIGAANMYLKAHDWSLDLELIGASVQKALFDEFNNPQLKPLEQSPEG